MGGKSTHPTLKQQRWTPTSNVAGCRGRCGGVEEGCYPQQISVSLQIANPAFQRVVWASRCWSWNGGGFFSSRSLINFNFATNIFLKENFWGGLLQQEGEKSGKWSAEKYFGWVFSLVVSNQLQIGGIVPQPRLLGPFLGWWDFGAYCKKSGLYGTGIRHCLCGSHRPGFISAPVSSTTSLNFPSFAVFQKFQSSDFLSVIRGLRLSCICCELRAYIWVYLGLSLSAVICWVRKTGWWDCSSKLLPLSMNEIRWIGDLASVWG